MRNNILKVLKESFLNEKTDYKKEKEKGLHGWFERQGGKGKSSGWVDCNTCRKDSKTGRKNCKPCGRKEGEKRSKYPSCRPTPSACGTKGKGDKWGKKTNESLEWISNHSFDYPIDGKYVIDLSGSTHKEIENIVHDLNDLGFGVSGIDYDVKYLYLIGITHDVEWDGRLEKPLESWDNYFGPHNYKVLLPSEFNDVWDVWKKQEVSEGLMYHISNNIPLSENIYRYGSESFFNLINETKKLYEKGVIKLNENDIELINTDIGEKVIFEGEYVWLDTPMEDIELLTEDKFKGKKTSSPKRDSSGGKAYKVYVSGCVKKTKNNPRGVKLIRFGSGGLKAKLNDKEAKKSYNARHGCSKGRHNDKCKAGYWSCRLPRYSKSLKISGGGTWW